MRCGRPGRLPSSMRKTARRASKRCAAFVSMSTMPAVRSARCWPRSPARAGATGNVLLVLCTGGTDRGLAEAKVEVLLRLPLRVLGAILNDVRPGSAYSYYSDSLEGYEVRDEDPEGKAGTMLLPDPA